MDSPRKKRAYNQSHPEIVLRVRQFFEHEKANPGNIDVNKVVERTAAATGLSTRLIEK